MTKFKVLMADSNPQMLSMMKEYFTAQENVSVFDTVTDGVSAGGAAQNPLRCADNRAYNAARGWV